MGRAGHNTWLTKTQVVELVADLSVQCVGRRSHTRLRLSSSWTSDTHTSAAWCATATRQHRHAPQETQRAAWQGSCALGALVEHVRLKTQLVETEPRRPRRTNHQSNEGNGDQHPNDNPLASVEPSSCGSVVVPPLPRVDRIHMQRRHGEGNCGLGTVLNQAGCSCTTITLAGSEQQHVIRLPQ
jgi:hypothetical protein